MLYVWLALTVVLVAVEAVTVQLVTIWFALGSLLALFSNMLGASVPVQIAVFVVGSVLSLVATRPLVKKFLNGRVVPTNADRYVGKRAVVTESINNDMGKGQVTIDGGSVWSARSSDGKDIPEGERVIVESIQGVKLIVTALSVDAEKVEAETLNK